jgi:glycosyltransferase involved in cell wall biosynthesis
MVASHTKHLTRVILDSKYAKYVGVSENITSYVLNFAQLDSKVTTILNKVDPPQHVISSNSDEALYLGRLDPEKDVLAFLERWVLLLETGADLPVLNVVGSGNLEKDVKLLCKNFPHKIILHGFLKGEDLDRVFKKCKIFVFTSGWVEPYGRTIVEAAARGMFIVGVDSPLVRNIIDIGKNGLFLLNDYSNLYECMKLAAKTEFIVHFNESRKKFSESYSTEDDSIAWKLVYNSNN